MSVYHLSQVFADDYFQEDMKARLLVAIVLADCANGDSGECWPSIGYLAHRSRCSPRQVFREIKQLELDGKLIVKRGHGKTNIYRLTVTVVNKRGDTMSGVTPCHMTPDAKRGDTMSPKPEEPLTRSRTRELRAPKSRFIRRKRSKQGDGFYPPRGL